MNDLNDVPGGVSGIGLAIAGTAATIAAAWRLFKAWGPSDRNAEANSSAQIAAIAQYRQMLDDEREARADDATRAAAELAVVRAAWAEDIKNRNADYQTERQARLASDEKREEAMQELWTLRGQVRSLQEQVQHLTAIVNRMPGGANG